jgi:hypothetical protein
MAYFGEYMSNKPTHTIMKYSLAKALMDAGVHHLDAGGGVSGVVSSGTQTALSPVSGVLGGVSNALTTTNSFNAAAPTQVATVGNQQATLANQLQQEAAGGGPNPAQIQYRQNAQQITQQQAALNAQNRALNPGLAARQSSNAAVQSQQQAAGGAAAQQAQQQIAAQQQMAGLTNQEQQGAENAQGINAQVAQNNTNAVNQTEGGLLNGIGGILGFAKGGKIPDHLQKMAAIYHPRKMATGGSISVPGLPNFSNANNLPQSNNDPFGSNAGNDTPTTTVTPPPAMPSSNDWLQFATTPQPGQGMPNSAQWASMMQNGPKALPEKAGGKIPGKPAVKGDSEKNDVVPVLASPGEVVIDRETMNDQSPIGKMARTVAAHIAQKNGDSDSDGNDKASEFMKSLKAKDDKEGDSQKGYAKVAESRRKRGKK